MNKILDRNYCEETVSDIQEDIYGALDTLPKDEYGFVDGSVEIKVVATFKPKQDRLCNNINA